MSLRVLAKQGVSYGIVGVLALLVDWSCFVALTWCGVATVLANLLARVSGAGIAYMPVSYTHLDVYKRQALR